MGRTGIIYLILFLFLFPFITSGQSATITGKITCKEDGSPLTGAHIVLQNVNKLTNSDFEGNYRITGLLPGRYRLAVSYIGYLTISRDLTLDDDDHIVLDFQLEQMLFIMDEAVITGNRVKVSKNISPLTLSMVTRNELEQSVESNVLPVLSSRIPGVFVTERGITGFGVGDGSAGRISIRGIGGSPNTQVLVMIDGHPQYAGIFGHPLPDAYVASDIEKVEVVRGPASLIYGSNAMAGAINIITRQQEADGLSLFGRAQYGSFNTQKYTGGAGYKKNQFHIMSSFNHDQTDGHRENSDFSITNGYIKAGYEINPNFRLIINTNLASFHSTDPGPVNTNDTSYQNGGHWGDFLRGEGSVTLENHFHKSEGALKIYYNGGEHKLFDGFHSTDHLTGVNLYQGLRLWPDNLITIGADIKSYGGFAENTLPEIPVKIADTSVYEAAAYVLVQNALADKLIMTAGTRLESNELFGTEWIPQIGLTYRPAKTTMVKGIVSKGFRSPTIRELFLFKPANPELKPERMWNYEVGAGQSFLKNRMLIEINGFIAKGNNLIQTTGIFPDVKNKNTGEFNHYGVELMCKYNISDNLHFLVSYAWLHTDKPVFAAPGHQLFAEGSYQLNKFTCTIEMVYIYDLITQTDPDVSRQNYTLINARVSYQVISFLTVFASGQNLLDQSYEINYGYPMPGITFLSGLNVKLNLYNIK